MKKTFLCTHLLLACSMVPLTAARKMYDERGNLVQPAETEKAQNTTEAPVKTPEAPPDQATNEEAQALQQQKDPLTKVYLETAQQFLRSNRFDKALEFLRKSQEAGEDLHSREAKLQSLWLRARRGDQNLEAETEGSDEKIRNQALLRIADGYSACSRENLKKPECISEAERLYAFLGELAPRSTEGRLARVRLGLMLLDAGRHEAALPHLTKTLMQESADAKAGLPREQPLDRAYFNLGQLYERPWYHRDMHKASAAYKQVLKFPGSPYHKAARERLSYLERFGTGYARP